MLGNHFRPWGKLDWVLSKMPNLDWSLLSCVSMEDRFIGSFSSLYQSNKLNESLFFKIEDPASKDSKKIENKLVINEGLLLNSGFNTNNITIESHRLLEPYQQIVESTRRFLAKNPRNIILDISTFPKRFFFPIVKLIMKSAVENFVVVYSTPEKYCSDELSGNPNSWEHLPLFMPVTYPESQVDMAIVGVGFMPFGLPELLLSKHGATPVKFLFPFPPGPPNYQRTWEFVRKIEKSFSFKPTDHIIRVDSNNMSDAFNYIVNMTDHGIKNTIFAPYGPKPISLAMCIYSTLHDSSVYYTQPTHYNVDYSSGIKTSYAYPIIINSNNLYNINKAG